MPLPERLFYALDYWKTFRGMDAKWRPERSWKTETCGFTFSTHYNYLNSFYLFITFFKIKKLSSWFIKKILVRKKKGKQFPAWWWIFTNGFMVRNTPTEWVSQKLVIINKKILKVLYTLRANYKLNSNTW